MRADLHTAPKSHQKETPQVKVFVVLRTFGIIVQFLFLLAGAR